MIVGDNLRRRQDRRLQACIQLRTDLRSCSPGICKRDLPRTLRRLPWDGKDSGCTLLAVYIPPLGSDSLGIPEDTGSSPCALRIYKLRSSRTTLRRIRRCTCGSVGCTTGTAGNPGCRRKARFCSRVLGRWDPRHKIQAGIGTVLCGCSRCTQLAGHK